MEFLIGPKKFDAPWKDLESQGWIAPAVCTEIRVPMPRDRRLEYASAEKRQQYRVAATNPSKLLALQALLDRHRDDRVLVIGQYLDQLDEVAALLGAPLITGKTPSREREKRMREELSGAGFSAAASAPSSDVVDMRSPSPIPIRFNCIGFLFV